jgi:hypothetical protein
MAGEQQLEQLERDEKSAGIEGVAPSSNTQQSLTRARRIEETAMIEGAERKNPIYEAAYQRALKTRSSKALEREQLQKTTDAGNERARIGYGKSGEKVTDLVARAQEKEQERGERKLSDQKGDKKSIGNKKNITEQNNGGIDNKKKDDRNITSKRQQSVTGKTRATNIQNKEPDISFGTSFLMLGTAILFDVFQFLVELIPVAGQILSILITIVAWATFYLWFKIKGIKFTKTKKFAFVGGFIIEFIPIINMLPTWTLSIIIMVSKKKIAKVVSQVPGGAVASEALKKVT